MASIVIVGRIGRDPELKYTQNGTPLASFSVADNVGYGDRETTTWYNVTVFGKRAEAIKEHFTKGAAVVVSGEVSLETFDKRDGSQGHSLKVTAWNVTFAPGNGRASSDSPDTSGFSAANDDEVPF